VTKRSTVAIVGAGPAGLSAAIYLKRVGIDPLVFESKRVGGLLWNANLVENYPGFPEGISGKELVNLLEKQAKRWHVNVIAAKVEQVLMEGESFKLLTNKDEYLTRFLLIATGTRPKSIELDGMESLKGEKLFYEIADIPFDFKNKKFLVVGGGDAAFDYSLNIISNGGKADIVFRGKNPTCIPLLLDRVKREKDIRIFPDTIPLAVHDSGEHVLMKCVSKGEERMLEGDCVFVACGRESNLDLLSSELLGDENRSNLLLIGDVKRGLHRQVGIAVGDGIAAAMTVVDRLKEEG